ncbi:hypothetical protein BC834DRAFT_907250 [Gloeopeniophorella convolvens]|nr:hypothetical protein BC834DRAFT_907250 [Gloeopeniophorella convolvens]
MSDARRHSRRAFKALMRSHRFTVPGYDLPLRVRPWFAVLTILIMLTLALLGLTNLAHALPLNDKLLHFVCLGIATGVFYFIFDVEEEYRRIWFWRHSPLILTGVVCFLLGGIASEFVQSLLPYKTFQFGDIVANLLGSSIGLYTAYHLERYHRRRREIARLYRPLSASASSLQLDEDAEDEVERATPLLPLHAKPPAAPGKGRARAGSIALADVWDEREELFGVGDDDEEDERAGSPAVGVPAAAGKPAKSVRWAEESA